MQSLDEQLSLLRLNCKLFDEGNETVAKSLSIILRVLLHETRRQKPLLKPLGYLIGNYYSTGPGRIASPKTLQGAALIGLVTTKDDVTARWQALLNETERGRWIAFDTWWNEIVVKDKQRRSYTRRQLVTHVADRDGGAHVDENVDEQYIDFSRNNSLGFELGDLPPTNRPELACMRQIAHEVLVTLSRRFVVLGKSAEPVVRARVTAGLMPTPEEIEQSIARFGAVGRAQPSNT